MSRFVAYGQNWEDVRLNRIFGDIPSGFFIDVGAGHPVFHSFTFSLYRQGWRGVNIEPLSSFFTLLTEERAADVNVQAVLGQAENGTQRFFEVADLRGNSTVRAEIASELSDQGHTVIEHEVPVLTLQSICERYAPHSIDLLKIDVEGAEADVLLSGDWRRFRPRLVVVEANVPETWEPMLLEQDYLPAAFDGVNNWYVEAGDADWLEVLARPVSTLDGFVPFELLEENAAAHAQAAPVAGWDAVPSAEHRRPPGSSRRPLLLLALASSNQLYSGTGRVLFETLGRLTSEFDIHLAIDDADPRNVSIARQFCREHGLALSVGASSRIPGAPDAVSVDLGSLLESRHWDIVMGVSWANAATNQVLLRGAGDAALAYLPLHQPSWTIPLDDLGKDVIESTHRKMLLRADVVLCLTPWERQALDALVAPSLPKCAVVPPGCDFSLFLPGSVDRPRDLLFVGDHREPRKRFDRAVSVLARVRSLGVDARLLVVGNESDRVIATLPAELADVVVSLGYVTEERLREAYREAAVLLLLSEYEAYGLPVIEALASATPVVMTSQPAPASLFAGHEGVHFVDADDLDSVAQLVSELLSGSLSLRQCLIDERSGLAQAFDWEVSARRTRDHLLAAWARRCRAVAGFITIPDRA